MKYRGMHCFKTLIKETKRERESQVPTFSKIINSHPVKGRDLVRQQLLSSMIHLHPLPATLAFTFIFLFLKITPTSPAEDKPSSYGDGSHTVFQAETHLRFIFIHFCR